MLLDISKALSFFACLLMIYRAAVSAFFAPGASWEDRFVLTLTRLGLGACVCLFSGLIFTWPVRSNPDGGCPLSTALPIRVFIWSSAAIAVLFLSSWYLCDLVEQAGVFISNRSPQGL